MSNPLEKFQDDHYLVEAFCRNCGWNGKVQIKRGRRSDDFLDAEECPNCSVRDLKRSTAWFGRS